MDGNSFRGRLEALAREIEGCAKYAMMISLIADDPDWFERVGVPDLRGRAEVDREQLTLRPYTALDVLVQMRRLCAGLASIADLTEADTWKGLGRLSRGLEEILVCETSAQLRCRNRESVSTS